MNDWKFLCDKVKVREDSRYLHHQGKPVVLLWGLGFKDRPWTPEQGEELDQFLQERPEYGGVYLIGGDRPALADAAGANRARIPAGPRSTGRSTRSARGTPAGIATTPAMDRMRKDVWEGDLAELKEPRGSATCRRRFPASRGTTCDARQPGTTMIPRRKGEFYWRQFAIFRALGIRTVFVGMFDEVDEGTAIYKVSQRDSGRASTS